MKEESPCEACLVLENGGFVTCDLQRYHEGEHIASPYWNWEGDGRGNND